MLLVGVQLDITWTTWSEGMPDKKNQKNSSLRSEEMNTEMLKKKYSFA